MATKYLSATASLSVAVWWTTSGGSTTTTAPGIGDDANLNGKTLTVDQAFTCDNIVGTTGAMAVSGSQTINANIGNAASGFSSTLSAAQTVTINGNVIAGLTASRINVSGASTVLNVAGNATGSGVAANLAAITITNTGTVSMVGTLTGGSASGSHGAIVQFGTFNLTGNLVDGGAGAIRKVSGTFNYTPTNAQTATIGGKVLYPVSGGLIGGGNLSGGLL